MAQSILVGRGRTLAFSAVIFAAVGASLFVTAQAVLAVDTIADAQCQQPGRVESARELIAEGKDFRLNASQSTVDMKDAIRKARGLTGGANKLIKMKAGDIDQYKNDLEAFKNHVGSYKAHLNQVEHDLGHCKETERLYQEHARKYTMHVDQYHLPPIPPPHLCPGMRISESENTKIANQMRGDQERLARAELELSNAEGRLANARQEDTHADAELLKRSKIVDQERNLAGEFESLKTELSLLNTQHKALLSGGLLPTPQLSSTKVSGTVKTNSGKKAK